MAKQARPTLTNKVMAGGIAGAVTTIIVFMLNTFKILPGGTQITGEVASALTTVIMFAVSYWVSPSMNDQVVSEQ
jgi:hypothetical protein